MSVQVASIFPASIRKEILELNLIFKAQPRGGNYEMERLMIYWKEYIEPSLTPGCAHCYDRVLRNFKAIENELIKLERESRILDGV